MLGIEPEEPSSEYGYLLPASALDAEDDAVFHVESFREKPDRSLAVRIVRHGGLWNSFVMVFRAARVLELLAQQLPEEYRALAQASRNRDALEAYYASTAAWNFSTDFLAQIAAHLVVVRAEHTGWSDWGTQLAIERTFAALNRVPPWHPPALTVDRYRASSQSAA